MRLKVEDQMSPEQIPEAERQAAEFKTADWLRSSCQD